MTNTTYYKLTPISEKPEKDGIYAAISATTHQVVGMMQFNDGKWRMIPRTHLAGYLSPVTEDELVKENERLRELLRGQSYSIWKGCNSSMNFEEWQRKFFDNNGL